MKERQRWRPEEDNLLRAYVKQYGPRDWHLVSQRTNKPLDRDAKSCLERWKNYLKPGIKKGSLTEDEQRHVIALQAKHGNKWKEISAHVPGRTPKRLGKWWEVFKEKQHKENSNKNPKPIEDGKYDHILETFAEKIVRDKDRHRERAPPGIIKMAPTGPTNALPPWLASSTSSSSPSVTLTLSPSVGPPPAWMRNSEYAPIGGNNLPSMGVGPIVGVEAGPLVNELMECCRELEEGHRLWAAHRNEATWRLKRVELQLESEKACRRREKVEEIEAKVKALREEQKASLDRIEAEYREQLAGLRREAEVKEQKLAEQWAAKHLRLTKFLEQMGCRSVGGSEQNGR